MVLDCGWPGFVSSYRLNGRFRHLWHRLGTGQLFEPARHGSGKVITLIPIPDKSQSEQMSANPKALRFVVLVVCLSMMVLLFPALKAVALLASNDDRYIQVIVGPLVGAFLIYWDRRKIFSA